MVRNPPANAGDAGLIPGLGRFHMMWSGWARVPELLSLCSRACEPQLLSPCARTTEARAPQQEKPPQGETRAQQQRVAPIAATRESPRAATKTQPSQRLIKKKKKKQCH